MMLSSDEGYLIGRFLPTPSKKVLKYKMVGLWLKDAKMAAQILAPNIDN